MPTGTPDFGAQPSNVSPSFDGGEDTNHLLMGGGNISRSGRWFWATGFEGGGSADVATGGAAPYGGPHVTNLVQSWQGNYSLLSKTNAVIDDEQTFYKYFISAQAPGKWGIETMMGLGSLNSEVDFRLIKSSAAERMSAELRFISGANINDVKLYYLDASNTYQLLADFGSTFALSVSVFHNVKFVVDFSEKKMVRVYVDGTVYEMNVPAYMPGGGVDSRDNFQIKHRTKIAGESTAVFDNVILTADEP